MKKALIVIDLQQDYFPEGKFPLWNSEKTLKNIEKAVAKANSLNMPVILIRHIADGKAGFFNEGTDGADIHPELLKAAPNAVIVVKTFADSFHKTRLESVLDELQAKELLICGMMTQNCVNHTALAKTAEKYEVKILADCCTTVNETLHKIALNAVSTRIALVNSDDAF